MMLPTLFDDVVGEMHRNISVTTVWWLASSFSSVSTVKRRRKRLVESAK